MAKGCSGRGSAEAGTAWSYWPVALASSVILMALFLDPAALQPPPGATALCTTPPALWPPPIDASKAKLVMASPFFWLCMVSFVAGTAFIHGRGDAAEDRFVMLWWWTNMTVFQTFCDIFSGLLQVMPNLTELYKLLNGDHKLPRFHEHRIVMDVIYCYEIFGCLLMAYCFRLYLRKDPTRFVWDAVIAGLHTGGAVAYYVPDIVLLECTSIITNLDRIIASCWIFASIWIFRRSVSKVAALTKVKSR